MQALYNNIIPRKNADEVLEYVTKIIYICGDILKKD